MCFVMRICISIYRYFRPHRVHFSPDVVQVSESREMTNQNNIANYINDQRRKARERFERL